MANAVAPDLNDTAVRKWGTLLLGISDYGAETPAVPATPAALFAATGLPVAVPNGVKDLGFITTAGVVDAKSLSSTPTNMLQSLEPVRSDLTGIEKSITVSFGESNAWVNALRHGLPVAQWPASRDDSWGFTDGEVSDFPEYVLWLWGMDGVGDAAVYRAEVAYRAKITAMTDITKSREASEEYGFTFGLYRDPVTGFSHVRAQDSPSYTTHLTSGG